MALRSHVQAFLESIPPEGVADLPNVMELRRRQTSRTVPTEQRPYVWHVADRSVRASRSSVRIRMYTSSMQHGLPLLLYFHGGGFCIGSLDSHDLTCRRLANALGWKVIAVDYRLAPEHPFPAGVEDCYAITKWCGDNAASLDINPSMIAVAGDSSGGNFAAVVAMMARDRGTPEIQKQVLICPNTAYYQSHLQATYASYLECGSQYLTTSQGISHFWSLYIQDGHYAHHPYVSPVEAGNLSNLPPALILTAEYDPLRDEGEAYARRLDESGVSVRAVRYTGTIHGFMGLFPDEEEGRQAYAAIRHFLHENSGHVSEVL